MNKLIPLFLGLMLPLAGAFADEFTDQAVEFCRSKGGSYSLGTQVAEGDNYCRQVTCKKTNNSDGKYEIPEGSEGPEANVEATKRVCLPKSVVDGQWTNPGAAAGAGGAAGAAGAAGAGGAAGAAGAAGAGGAAGAAGGSGGSGDAYYCEELEGEGRIQPGGLCYNECKRKATGILGWIGIGPKKEGFERKSCVECLLRHPGVYRVKREYLPRDSNGRVIGDRSVDLGVGVTVRTGVIVCKDAKGNTVSINGTICPTGTTVISGGAVSGSTSGGSIVIAGTAVAGAGGGVIGAGGGINWPDYCLSQKKKDIEKCDRWMLLHKRFICAAGASVSICTGGADVDIMSRYDTRNCVNCQVGGRRQSTLSGIAEIVGAIAPPLAAFGSAYVGARAYQKGQEAWAGAAAVGFEQCQLAQNNYLQYLQANELPGLTPAQQAGMNCNGFSLGGYAGLQNPGLGGWYGAGYTPGFIGGMMGPFGGYNPYGTGGYVGGAIGGVAGGGYVGGGYVGGGFPGGMAGGLINGISLAGGVAGGYPGGVGGYVAGGYPGGVGGYVSGGYPGGVGGYVAGGYPGGVGGYVAGGYPGGVGGYVAGGYPGGVGGVGGVGGFVNGISIAGGVAGGYAQGGYAGGVGGYMAGGYTQSGYAGGYMAAGYNGGYMAGGGFAAGGGMAGGFDYASSQQAANYDRMMQQQGTSFQMGMGGMGGMGGYSAFGAGGYPMNAGFGIQATVGGGFYP